VKINQLLGFSAFFVGVMAVANEKNGWGKNPAYITGYS